MAANAVGTGQPAAGLGPGVDHGGAGGKPLGAAVGHRNADLPFRRIVGLGEWRRREQENRTGRSHYPAHRAAPG